MVLKISTFMISLVLVGLIIGGTAIFIGSGTDNYNINYDENVLEPYNNIQAIYNQTEAIENEATQIDPNTNPLQELVSIIDGFFTGAYNTLVLAWSSFDIFNNIADTSIDHAGSGEFTNLFKISIGIIVTLLIVIGIIVSAIVKKDL